MKAKDRDKILNNIERLHKKIVKEFDTIAKKRDNLRDLMNDLEEVLESVDVAEQDFAECMRAMESAIDNLSQYL